MKILFLISYILIQFACNQQSNWYDYNIFGLTYPRGYCKKEKKCNETWLQETWDQESLAIHGFLPSSSDDLFEAVEKDPHCWQEIDLAFNQKQFTKKQMEELNKYWPAFGTLKGTSFWEHEWNFHGKCYLKTYKDNFRSSNMRHMLDKNTKKLPDLEVFHKYFSTTIDKLKYYNITLPYRNYTSKADIAKQIKINQDSFVVNCQLRKHKKSLLVQFYICFSSTQNLGEQKIQECPLVQIQKYDEENRCHYPLLLS